ncbi:DUF6994 family protein [Nocardioides pelophilus]|uniref:DUF6994 family protein n=1 Tax=Nocardioides pelophilus TaxID=2172019 RepID=UPI0016020B41|nr:hypothetical protein [Nocardioides pelophilus]
MTVDPPWLKADGNLRCFACETASTYPGRDNDPDAYSSQLRESHQMLWTKRLPDGQSLEFSARLWSDYLRVTSLPGDWTVGSDIIATIHAKALPVDSQGLRGFANGHVCEFCTIGGYIVFPNQIAQQVPPQPNPAVRRWSINQARGMDGRISDRFDLTLEAIRLLYEGIVDLNENPIGDVLEAYRWWFDLFGQGADGFRAYAKFFFLTPMLDPQGRVKPFAPLTLVFDDALPRNDATAYGAYMAAQRDFVNRRNELISEWWSLRPQ